MHGPHCTKKPSAFYGGANIAKKSYAQCKKPDFLTLLHSESIFSAFAGIKYDRMIIFAPVLPD